MSGLVAIIALGASLVAGNWQELASCLMVFVITFGGSVSLHNQLSRGSKKWQCGTKERPEPSASHQSAY